MIQQDMFEPAHISLFNQASLLREKAAPLIAKAKGLEKEAFALCPHDNIDQEIIYHEDEYGSSVQEWTEVSLRCKFCGKRNIMLGTTFRRHNFKTTLEALNWIGEKK